MRPVDHGPDVPVPTPPNSLDDMATFYDTDNEGSSSGEEFSGYNNEPQLFTQPELNDLVRDLDLPKEAAKLLG